MTNLLPAPGTKLADVETPALVLDLAVLERNIAVASDFFRNRPARIRAVTKGHKSPAIAKLQMAAEGAVPGGLSCAKVSEAEIMVEAGATDIRMIEQVVGREKIARLMALARQVRVVALVDDRGNVDELAAAAEAWRLRLDVMVEIDIAMRRCGVQPGAPAVELARYVAAKPSLRFTGISGHEASAGIADRERRLAVQRANFQHLVDTRADLERAGLPVAICAGGATAAWNVAGTIDGMTEIEPGAYATMDFGTKTATPDIGFDLALTVLTSVISQAVPERAVIDAGHKMIGLASGGEMPGVLALAGAKVNRLNSEHGILDLEGDARALRIGDKVQLMPWYYGTAINANDHYIGVRDGIVECVWRIAARGAHQ